MEAEEISEAIAEMRDEVVDDLVSEYVPPESIDEQWDTPGLEQALATEFAVEAPVSRWLDEDDTLTDAGLRAKVAEAVAAGYAAKVAQWQTASVDMRQVEKQLMLQVLDQKWKEHLAVMDHLRQGIHLRAYAQKQPKQEYKRESFTLFQTLQDNINREVIRLLSRIKLANDNEIEEAERHRRNEAARRMAFNRAEPAAERGNGEPRTRPETVVRATPKIGRNEPCPCGSGRKYKPLLRQGRLTWPSICHRWVTYCPSTELPWVLPRRV